MNDKYGFNTLLKSYYSSSPKDVYGKSNLSYVYWYNYLMRVLISTFEFKNFPTSWDIDYFREVLFKEGVVGITEHYKSGNIALSCSFSGINPYGKPTRLIFSNPVLGSFVRKIGINSEIVYFDYFNSGYDTMHSIVSRYAVLLANLDASLNVTLINSRVAMVFTGTNKAEIRSAQKMYDDVTEGKPAVFHLKENGNNTSLGEVFFNNVKNNYIGNDLLVTKQTIINDFCTHVGINNSNTQKRERLIKDEAESNNQMTKTLSDMWLENINSCFDRVRVLYPYIKTKVERRCVEMKEVLEDEL